MLRTRPLVARDLDIDRATRAELWRHGVHHLGYEPEEDPGRYALHELREKVREDLRFEGWGDFGPPPHQARAPLTREQRFVPAIVE